MLVKMRTVRNLFAASALALVGCKGEKEQEQTLQEQSRVTVQRAEERKPSPPAHPPRNIPDDNKPSFEELLKTSGAKGLMHGSVSDSSMFVFTWGVLSKAEHYALILKDRSIQAQLNQTARHQVVTIFGKLLNKGTLQQHVLVEKVELGEKWDPKVNFKYTDQVRLPNLEKHLREKKEIDCIVHAVLKGGESLIVNYMGHVIPVYVQDTKRTKDLWSSDKIRLRFNIQDHKQGPLHLSLRTENDVAPITVFDDIKSLKGQKIKKEGILVFFPKSPFTTSEIWGLEETDKPGTPSRVYALYNSESKEELDKIYTTLSTAWANSNSGFIRRSSSFSNPNLPITVEGTVTQFGQNQGNPVIEVKFENIKIK